MIRLIAHRGLFAGPYPEAENHPEQIRATLSLGFDAECDVWHEGGKWWLGHDQPTHMVDDQFVNRSGLWLHAKNLAAMDLLVRRGVNVFWHDTDAYTLTGRGFIWAYPGQPLSERTVWVQPEWDKDWRAKIAGTTCYGICSKHVAEIRQLLRSI